MMLFNALLAGSWHWLAAGVAVIVAIFASYLSGKKTGKTQQQAKADIESAQKEAAQVSAVAHQQQQHREEAKRVEAENSNLDDAAARNKLRQSRYHQP